MSKSVEPIPGGRSGVTPYLTVRGAADAITFYQEVFGARELFRLTQPGGGIGHAELQIGNGLVYISDEYPEMDVRGPLSVGSSPVLLHLYVADADAVVERAVAKGARVLRPLADQFYGDRGAKLQDPFGHIWWVATHIEDVSHDEMRARAQKLFGSA